MGFIQSFDARITSASDVLTEGLFTSTSYALMRSIATVITPICLTIISICFVIEFLKISMKMDMMKWEYALKVLAKLVLAKVVIDIAPTVLSTIYETSAYWVNSALSLATTGTTLSATGYDALQTLFDAITPFQAIGLAVTMLIPFLAIMLCGLIIQIMAYGRMFEIYVYVAISPLPCAFFPLDDGGGEGMSRITLKFFKSFFAVCLQGLFMIICMQIFNGVVGEALKDAINNITTTGTTGISDISYNIFIGSVCLTVAIARCGSWAKSILDAM